MHSFTVCDRISDLASNHCQGRLNPVRPDRPLHNALPIVVVRPFSSPSGVSRGKWGKTQAAYGPINGVAKMARWQLWTSAQPGAYATS